MVLFHHLPQRVNSSNSPGGWEEEGQADEAPAGVSVSGEGEEDLKGLKKNILSLERRFVERVQNIKLDFHNQAIERKASLNSPGRWDSGILNERDSELLLSDTCVVYIVDYYCVFMLTCVL